MERIEVPLDCQDLEHLKGIVNDGQVLYEASTLFSLGGSLTIHDSNGNYIGLLSFDEDAVGLVF